MPQLPIGDVGPCEVTWDYGGATPVIITPHLGKVTVRMADTVTDVNIDGQGVAPIEAFFEGTTVELEVPMSRSTLSQLANTIGYRNLGTLAGNVLTLHNVAGIEMMAHAKAIVIKPMCDETPDPDPRTWTVFYKCHPYRDFELGYDRSGQRVHMVKFKIFPNQDAGYGGGGYQGDYFQEGVICPPETPLLTRRYLDPAWFTSYKDLCVFNDKLCIWDHGPNVNDGQVLQTENGVDWTTLFSRTDAQIGSTSGYCGNAMAVYNGNLFITKYSAGGAVRSRVIEWNGTDVTLHLEAPVQDNYMASNLVVWDDRLWVLLDATPFQNNHRRVVYYYDGAAWTAITDYDGAAYLNYNRAAALPEYHIKHRCTRLFVFNNELYLIATRYTGTKWAWEVWKFNAVADDNFTLLYDSDVFDDGYALAAIIEFEGTVYIVGNNVDNANGNPGIDGKIYTSPDMISWALEATQAGMGFPYGEELFQPATGECLVPSLPLRFYLNCVNVFPEDLKTWIRYWDEDAGAFTLEQEIATNANSKGGGLKVFNNALYAGKWMEVYANAL